MPSKDLNYKKRGGGGGERGNEIRKSWDSKNENEKKRKKTPECSYNFNVANQ